MRLSALNLAILVGAPLVAAHGAVTSYVVDGKEIAGWDGYNAGAAVNKQTPEWSWTSYDPIFKVNAATMTCNTPGRPPADTNVINIAAGSNITAKWKQWTHQQGPVMVWMYYCGTKAHSACGIASGKGWFKIDQAGLFSGRADGNDWATGTVYRTGKWTSTIPKNLKPGNYVIRHELIAMHQADAPQFYPECANLVVTGSGTGSVPASCLFNIPGYAAQTDPGINVDVYSNPTLKYTFPAGDVCNVS